MVDTEEKKPKKVAINEEDVYTLLQRYSAGVLLSLLKEVSQFVNVKIDWNELVMKTETGIKSAREYQMLWRHLAYRQPWLDTISPDDQPLDDDSDLEYELDAWPTVSASDALDASNCVKVITSGSAQKSRMLSCSNIEVPRVSSENTQIQKRSQATRAFGEGLDTNGSTSNNQKKRKPISEEEDPDLLANVRKGEFKGDKNTQRAQRANPNRKKQGSAHNTADSHNYEVQLANKALGVAFKDSPSIGGNIVGNGHAGPSTKVKMSASERNLPVTKVTLPSLAQPTPASSGKPAPVQPSSKLCPQKKAPPLSSVNADIQAAAIAAGARIASPSEYAAVPLLKAAQSKNAVHIRGGAPLVKTSTAGDSSPLPPNVHFIRTGLATTPTSLATGTASFASGGHQTKGSTVGSSILLPKMRSTSPISMEQNATQEVKTRTTTVVNVQGSDTKAMTGVQEDGASFAQCLPNSSDDNNCQTFPGKHTTHIGKS